MKIALRSSPAPEASARRASSVLAAQDARGLAELGRSPEALARVLSALCGTAPFFARFLRAHPDWLAPLVQSDLSTPRSRARLQESLDAWMDGSEPGDNAIESKLRHFKYRELARITVRDCSDDLVPLADSEVTFLELSLLADVLLERSLATAMERVAQRLEAPTWVDVDGTSRRLGFVVLALGKLGASELNYSSDVDLVYVHEAPRAEIVLGPGKLAPGEYFVRVASELSKLVSSATADGFLYRVDLELRPEGSRGGMVVSDGALVSYFETTAHGWELAAFTKARPVAGDHELGWHTIRSLDPMIYSKGMNYAGVEAIRSLKKKVEQARTRADAPFDVKLGRGGIRDVEFVAQALQLLHGARIPQIRERSTPGALRSLRAVGLLPDDAGQELERSYLFLRRLENRLQMVEERQTHLLPGDPEALAQLARAMGFLEASDAAGAFEATLEGHRQQVLSLSGALLSEVEGERIFELFSRNVPHLLALPAAREMVDDLATRFAQAIQLSPHPERALDNLDRFIHGVGSRRFYYELLIDRPELVGRLAALFASSNYLSSYFAVHPRLIESVFEQPERLLLTPEELRADFEAIEAETRDVDNTGDDPTEMQLKALRLFHHRQVINVGLLDVDDLVTRIDAAKALTQIAEVCLDRALDFGRRTTAQRASDLPPEVLEGAFLIVAMGKLATSELSYGSDLDVVFLHDASGEHLQQAQEHFARVAQRLISMLQVPTAEGRCYEIDARLRPSGNQGTLVTSLASFRRYHAEGSQNWERQALLRARPVAGDEQLGAAFEAARLEILCRPPAEDLAQEIHRVRQRMESELARETRSRHDFKTGRGGVLDVESVVDSVRLLKAQEHPELLAVDRVELQIQRLASLGALSADDARTLSKGWEFLQKLGSRLRIVENRSISDLDEQRGDLDGVALRLGYGSESRGGSRRALLHDYRRHADAIRAVYCKTLGVN